MKRGQEGDKRAREVCGGVEDEEERMESIGAKNGKREQDESYREGMYACLLCLLNKEMSLTG